MNYLSPKKKRFVQFIKFFTSENDRPPTFVEIMSGLNIRSLGTIDWYVKELEKENVIKRMKGKNGKRALSVLEENIDNQLPFLGLIAAGYPLEVFESNEYMEVTKEYAVIGNYILKVNGNSMIDTHIQDGDYVIVKGTKIASNGDIVVGILNNEATLKRYYLKENKIELHPENSDYDILHIRKTDDFKINGIVLGMFRKYN